MLALPSSCASCLLLVGCGYMLRNTRILSRTDGQAGLQIALSLTLPAFIYQSLTHGGVLLGSCFVAAIAGILYALLCALSSWIVFRKRAPRERAQLCGLTLGGEVPTLAMAWIACMWSVAGVEAAAVFACVNVLAEQLLSFVCFGSSGPGNPRAYRHADGGVYDGEWNGTQKAGAGVYRYPSGARYEGEWRDNLKDGRGVYYYADGGKFEGEFSKGERDGLGLRTWPSGVVKAAEFRKGVLQRQVPLLDCGTTLMRAKEAAHAARSVRVGGDSPVDALRQPSLYPPLLGLWGAFAVLLSGWQAPEWLQLSTSILGGLHIPLALLAFGATFRPARPERRAAGDVISVLSVRLLAGLSVSVILLLLTPQLLPYAIRSAAVVVCLLAPISQKALQYAQDFKLNERICESAVAVSLLVSNLLIVAFTAFAFLNDVVPISALKGVVQISTVPLTKVCLALLGVCSLVAWLAPWYVEQLLAKSPPRSPALAAHVSHASSTPLTNSTTVRVEVSASGAVDVSASGAATNGHGSVLADQEAANGHAAGEHGADPSSAAEGIESRRGSTGTSALPNPSRAAARRIGGATYLKPPVCRVAPGRSRPILQDAAANVVQLNQPRALRRGVPARRVCAVVATCPKVARHVKLIA